MPNYPNLIIDVRPGEFIDLDGIVKVGVIHKSGNLVRLCINAPPVVSIQKKYIGMVQGRAKDDKVEPD